MEQQGGESRRITIHKPEDFAGMRRAGQLAAEALDHRPCAAWDFNRGD